MCWANAEQMRHGGLLIAFVAHGRPLGSDKPQRTLLAQKVPRFRSIFVSMNSLSNSQWESGFDVMRLAGNDCVARSVATLVILNELARRLRQPELAAVIIEDVEDVLAPVVAREVLVPACQPVELRVIPPLITAAARGNDRVRNHIDPRPRRIRPHDDELNCHQPSIPVNKAKTRNTQTAHSPAEYNGNGL